MFGNMLVNAHSAAGAPIDLALFGVRPGSFLDPTPVSGSRLGSADGLVVSSTLLDAGGFVREIGRQMFATFGATLPAPCAGMFARTGTTCGS